MEPIFDTHAHYDDEAFDADREELLASMPAQGVGLILDPGCDLETSRRAVELARRFPHVYAAVGWHPENCAPYTGESLAALRELAREPKVAAIGEIGLDYHWEQNPPRELQQKVFRDQLALARELDLPVVVHDRDAHADSLAIVKEFPRVRGVFHCFSGSVEMARELIKRGWYLGFDGPVTYKNARRTVETALECPLDRMLLETDSPYMAPVPARGERNDSRNIRYIAEKLAALRGMDADELIALTADNGKRLFGIFSGCRLRRITAADDAAMAAIVRTNLESYHLNVPGTAYFDPELAHLSRFYAEKPDERAYFVAEDGAGQVLGGAGFAEFSGFPACAELQKLYLSDAAKGKGLGRRLLETVEERARQAGYRLLYLETHSALKSAIRLYEKAGFRAIGKPPCVFHSTMDLFYTKELN